MSGGSSRVLARLAELGLTLPQVVPPLASYRPAVRFGDQVYISGQLPIVDGTLVESGRVGDGDDLVTPTRAAELARVCALNVLAAAATVTDLDEVVAVVKVVGFVAGSPSFAGQAAVVNGASDLFGEVFGEAGRHARSAVGVLALPLDAPVEVEAVLGLA